MYLQVSLHCYMGISNQLLFYHVTYHCSNVLLQLNASWCDFWGGTPATNSNIWLNRVRLQPLSVEDLCDRTQEGRFRGPNPEWTGLYQAHCNVSSPNLFPPWQIFCLHHRYPAVALTPAKRWPRPSSVRGINNPGEDGSGTHQRDTIWHPSDNTIMTCWCSW